MFPGLGANIAPSEPPVGCCSDYSSVCDPAAIDARDDVVGTIHPVRIDFSTPVTDAQLIINGNAPVLTTEVIAHASGSSFEAQRLIGVVTLQGGS